MRKIEGILVGPTVDDTDRFSWLLAFSEEEFSLFEATAEVDVGEPSGN